MSPGRPSLYTEEIANEICERLAAGQSLNEICRDDHMPAESTVRNWAVDDKHSFFAKYARAREVQADFHADELLAISDDGSNDWMARQGKDDAPGYVLNGEHVQRSRLRVDTRKWLMARMAPRKYGERTTTELTGKDGGAIQTENVSDIELAKAMASLLAKAAQ